MLRTVEFKLYPTTLQAETLSEWMFQSCRVYNLALEQRTKSYKRRKESVGLYDQFALLTKMRGRIEPLRNLPLYFARDALRRVDRAFKAFFRRVKAGEKPGYPRFKSRRRYNSLELLSPNGETFKGGRFSIPKLGGVRFRAGKQSLEGVVKLSRVVHRASGWFGQVLLDDTKPMPKPKVVESIVGIDVGLNTFAALSNGEKIENPRFGRKSAGLLRRAQRAVSRCVRGSRRRYQAIHRLQRIHERIAAQRKVFCHKHSSDIVRRFDLIGFEKLQIRNMVKSTMARSIMDAAWGMFTSQIASKAASAGKLSFAVNPRGTSQTCPHCGTVAPKKLSERIHDCPCGCHMDRDYASSVVIEARAVGLAAASGVEVGPLSVGVYSPASPAVETRESPN